MFNTLIEGFGIANKQATMMSQNLTQLAYDMSSFLNIDYETSLQKIKSGISGEIEPMRAVGIALDQATLQELAYKLGLEQKVNEMTRAQKTELLYYQTMTATSKMHGDMARTIMSPANALRVLQQQFTLAAREIGNIFIPMLMTVVPYLIAFAQIVTEVARGLASFFGFELPTIDYSSLSAGVSDIGAGLDSVGDSAAGASNAVKELKGSLAGFDELNVITQTETGGGAGGGGAGAGGVGGGGGLGLDLPTYDALEGLATQVDDIKKKITDWLGITDALKTGNWDILQIWKKMDPIAKAILGVITAWAGIKLVGWLAGVLNSFKTVGSFIGGIFAPIIGLITKGWGLFTGSVIESQLAAGIAVNKFTVLVGVFARLLVIISGIISFGTGFSGMLTGWNTAIDKVKNGVDGASLSMKDMVKNTALMLAGGALIGGALAGPIGALVGLGVAGVAAITTSWVQFKRLEQAIGESRVYGKAKLSVEELAIVTQGLTGSLQAQNDKFRENNSQLDDLSKTAQKSSQKFQTMFEQIAIGSNKVTNSDFAKLTSALDTMVKDSLEKITTLTDTTFQTLSEVFKESTVMTEDQEKETLRAVIDGGKAREEEVQKNRDVIYNINKKATEEGRILSEDEYKIVMDATTKINTLTDVKANERLASKATINSKLENLDKSSYAAVAELLKTSLTDGTKLIDENYEYRLAAAYTAADNAKLAAAKEGKNVSEQDAIYKKVLDTNRAVADKEHIKDAENLNKQLEDTRMKFANKLISDWKTLDAKNKNQLTAAEKIQKAMIEKQLSDMGIAGNTLADIAYSSGTKAGQKQTQGWDAHKWLTAPPLPNISGAYEKGREWAQSISRGWNQNVNFKMPNFQYDTSKTLSEQTLMQPSVRWTSFTAMATGGFPDMGQMFIAREAGPELVGKIGNSSAVINNNQIISGVAQGVAEAVSSVLGGDSSGQPLIINIGGETAYKGYTKNVATKNNQFGYNVVEV